MSQGQGIGPERLLGLACPLGSVSTARWCKTSDISLSLCKKCHYCQWQFCKRKSCRRQPCLHSLLLLGQRCAVAKCLLSPWSVPYIATTSLSHVKSHRSESAGKQPYHTFSVPAEMAASVVVTDGCFSAAPSASQKEAHLHLHKTLNSFKSPRGEAIGYEHILY